ncbi:MAG TPA: hypothetical protein VFO10_14975 [Oligoflexus sp.]|uniref:hypothetical protein n=1 Tax=Oligoflexus sp. TaxID=1971216 RepID=UPI002D80E542|nr:hypothetical protein [Oligoflexus sp.]HET9238562.1 hypothetical protein [Oligoflexus sp.]
MEKKPKQTRLRLVTTDETKTEPTIKDELQENAQPRSKFAQQMNSFADDLDRMIESILRS